MTNEEIKNECDLMYNRIMESEARLKLLRKYCKHSDTFIGNYSYRPGAIYEAVICFNCGKLINFLNN